MADWVRTHRPDAVWACPQLPPSPREAFALLLQISAGWPVETSAVIGSSLGGFYATALAERLGWPAVLINPAVDPARDLARHIGETASWHDPAERFFFRAEFIDELRALRPATLTRLERYLPIIASGDEVLDPAEMQARYAGTPMRVVAGSDHTLSDFDEHLPALIAFFGLDRPRTSTAPGSPRP